MLAASRFRGVVDRIGVGYSQYRRPDERIARRIDGGWESVAALSTLGRRFVQTHESLRGRGGTIVRDDAAALQNGGAVDTSIRRSVASFRDQSFDAALAILTIHHWSDCDRGLAEMRRVARDRVVIVTWDPEHPGFWLVQDYLPEILVVDRPKFPSPGCRDDWCEGMCMRHAGDRSDGFLGGVPAAWPAPEAYLDAAGARGNLYLLQGRFGGRHLTASA